MLIIETRTIEQVVQSLINMSFLESILRSRPNHIPLEYMFPHFGGVGITLVYLMFMTLS